MCARAPHIKRKYSHIRKVAMRKQQPDRLLEGRKSQICIQAHDLVGFLYRTDVPVLPSLTPI